MAAPAAAPPSDPAIGPDRSAVRFTPVKLWATLGAASVVLMVVVLSRWVASGIESVDPGPDAYGGTKLVLMRVLEWGQFAALLGLLAWFVVRPLARRRPLGFDGLFVLAALALNFWDPLDNYLVFSFQYNAHFLNVGSWGGFIPGWHSAGGATWAVPVAFVFGAYTWAFFVAARMGCAIADRLRRARPQWSTTRIFGVVFIASALLEAVCETAFLRTGTMANIGTPDALTAWGGGYDGWPVYNPILFGITWSTLAWLRWSRDERGLSAVERGVERLAVGSRTATAVRFLAISAFVQVSYIGLYFVPWNLLALLHDARPPLPSYFSVP